MIEEDIDDLKRDYRLLIKRIEALEEQTKPKRLCEIDKQYL